MVRNIIRLISGKGSEIHSLERVVENWTLWTEMLEGGEFEGLSGEPNGPIKAEWWNPRWVPLTSNGGGDHHCLDLDPAEGGQVGQIMEFWHDWEVRTRIAPSFTAWFEAFVTGCETGRFVWSKAEESFILANEK